VTALGQDYAIWVGQVDRPLQDARRRTWWANSDGEALDAAIRDFIESDPYSIHTVKGDGDSWKATLHRNVDPADEFGILDTFARLCGSFLDNHRAALNYVACAVAQRALDEDPSLADPSLPWNEQLHPWTGVEFPVFNKPAKYREKNKVRKLPDKYRNLFEQVQPYKGSYEGLWILQELSAEYRHRVVHPAALIPRSSRYAVSVRAEILDDIEIEPLNSGLPLKDGDEIMAFDLPDLPESLHPYVTPHVPVSIGIDHAICAGRDFQDTLNLINQDVAFVMVQFERLFPPNHDAPSS